jgi:hypothetical protein
VFVVLRKAWNDSVWSKVIAAGITAALGGAGSVAWAHWDAVREALDRPVQTPLWVVLLLAVGVAVLLAVARLGRRERAAVDDAEMDVQPNAVPIMPVEMRDEEINLQEAYRLISDRLGLNDRLGGDADADARLAIFAGLRQKARDGDIVVRGRQQRATGVSGMYKPREAIPPEHWRAMGFDIGRYVFGDAEDLIRVAATQPDNDKDRRNPESYIDLVVSRRVVEEVWPRS